MSWAKRKFLWPKLFHKLWSIPTSMTRVSAPFPPFFHIINLMGWAHKKKSIESCLIHMLSLWMTKDISLIYLYLPPTWSKGSKWGKWEVSWCSDFMSLCFFYRMVWRSFFLLLQSPFSWVERMGKNGSSVGKKDHLGSCLSSLVKCRPAVII